MHANPEAVVGDESTIRAATLIAQTGDPVGFLDAPGLDLDALAAAISEAVQTLDAGSILTVYNEHRLGHSVIEELCKDGALVLIGEIAHPNRGTTYTLLVATN